MLFFDPIEILAIIKARTLSIFGNVRKIWNAESQTVRPRDAQWNAIELERSMAVTDLLRRRRGSQN